MVSHPIPILRRVFVALLFVFQAGLLHANEIVVPLRIKEEASFAGQAIDFGGVRTGSRTGRAPGGVVVRVEALGREDHAYRIHVEGNDPATLVPKEQFVVRIPRRGPGQERIFPYIINYDRLVSADGAARELFLWIPRYRAEGQLRLNNCTALLVVLDLSGDGVFDEEDFRGGTNVGLDRNGDGRIWGSDEWMKARQPLEFCGEVFQIDAVANDGSSITLSETALRIPKLGEPLPQLALVDLDGSAIPPGKWKDKFLLLDFWASWCAPCVEKFPAVKRLAGDLKAELVVIGINVDDSDRLEMAREIIQKYELPWPVMMSGLGDNDPLWRSLGSMGINHLNIPWYVLVDRKGILRYASNGGDDLKDVREKIAELKRRE